MAIAVLLALVGAYLGGCWALSRSYLSPDRTVPEQPSTLLGQSLPSRYGPTPCWLTPNLGNGKPPKTVFVLAHGYGGTRATWTRVMEQLEAKGYGAVAPAMPGQDASPDPTVGFGLKEARLLVDVVAWARSQPGVSRVVVAGVSMGGAAAWLATREGAQVDAVVSDGAYPNFDEATRRYLSRRLPGGGVILAPVIGFARIASGLDPSRLHPLDAAVAWRGKPALVIHGDADELFPVEFGERLRQAAGCEIWVVPGAAHAESDTVDLDGYVERLVALALRIAP